MDFGCIDDFLHCVKSAPPSDIHGWIECARIWDDSSLTPLSVPPASPLLLHSLQKFDSLSPSFRYLVCQVACRSILFQVDSRHLGAILHSKLQLLHQSQGVAVPRHEKMLQQYSNLLAVDGGTNDVDVEDLLKSFLHGSSWLGNVLKKPGTSSLRREEHAEFLPEFFGFALRYLEHCIVFVREGPWRDRLLLNSKRLFFSVLISSVHMDRDGEAPDCKTILTANSPFVHCEEPAFVLALRCCNLHHSILTPIKRIQSPQELYSSPECRSGLFISFLGAGASRVQDLFSQLNLLLKGLTEMPELQATLAPLLVCHLNVIQKREPEDISLAETDTVELLVDAWVDLDLRKWTELIVAIQGTLAHILGNSHLSNRVLAKLQSRLPGRSLWRCVEIELAGENTSDQSMGDPFSAMLIESDYISFSEQLFAILDKHQNTAKSAQSVPTVSLPTLTASMKHFEEVSLDPGVKKERVGLIFRALSQILTSEDVDLSLLSDVLLCLNPETICSAGACELSTVTDPIQKRIENSRDLSVPRRIKLLRGASHLVGALGDNVTPNGFVGLATASFGSLATNADSCLRSIKRSPLQAAQASDLLDILKNLWRCLSHRTENVLSEENIAALMALVRSCVKHGLSSEVPSVVRQDSLDFVVSVTSSPSNISIPKYATIVFQWVTSHSSFDEALQFPYAKKKILAILLCCIQCAEGSQIAFDSGVWSSVLAGYQAGLSETDSLARRFLYEYVRVAGADVWVCYTDRLKWGQRLEPESSHNGDGWDWLPSWLETSRINETLLDFPYFDTLVPGEEQNPATNRSPGIHTPSGGYSTGFILPLILAALESKGADRKGGGGKPGATQPWPIFFQKICDKGAMALALGSLCCDCESLRRVALSILSIASKMVDSEDAKNLSSWRERPQLALILNATRRAMAREFAESMNSSSNKSPLHVLPISPPCSIFLAKASLILTQPGDDLYPALNRYFLRLGEEHGSLQDFGRQPAFISLFCSSTTEESMASKERCWAIQTLGDSFITKRCFGPLMACHGFELLLSRVEGLVNTPDFFELDLIIRALGRILENCGQGSIDYLASKHGLLQWLCSLIVGRQVHEKSHRTFGEILALICLVLKKSSGPTDDETLLLIRGVGQQGIDLHLGSQSVSIATSLSSLLLHIQNESKGALGEINLGRAMSIIDKLRVKKHCAREILCYICANEILLLEYESPDAAQFCCLVLRTLLLVPNTNEHVCKTTLECLLRVAKCFQKSLAGANELGFLTMSVRALCSKWRESRKAWTELSLLVQ